MSLRTHHDNAGLPRCSGSGRCRAKDRCWHCEACQPLHWAALYAYLQLLFGDMLASEQARRPGGNGRLLKLLTIRIRRGASHTEVKLAVDRLLRHLTRRREYPIGRYFGVLAGSPKGLHVHVIVECENRIDGASLPRVDCIESVLPQALRGEEEAQITRGGRFVHRDDFCSDEAWPIIETATVGHLEYVATQPVPEALGGRKAVFHSRPPEQLGTPFGRFRAEWVDALTGPELPPRLLSVGTRCAQWRDAREEAIKLENKARNALGLPSLPREVSKRGTGITPPEPVQYPPPPRPPEPAADLPPLPIPDGLGVLRSAPAVAAKGRTDPRYDPLTRSTRARAAAGKSPRGPSDPVAAPQGRRSTPSADSPAPVPVSRACPFERLRVLGGG